MAAVEGFSRFFPEGGFDIEGQKTTDILPDLDDITIPVNYERKVRNNLQK